MNADLSKLEKENERLLRENRVKDHKLQDYENQINSQNRNMTELKSQLNEVMKQLKLENDKNVKLDSTCSRQLEEMKQIERRADNFRTQLESLTEKLKSETLKTQKLESAMKAAEGRFNQQLKDLQTMTRSVEIPKTPGASKSSANNSKETTPVAALPAYFGTPNVALKEKELQSLRAINVQLENSLISANKSMAEMNSKISLHEKEKAKREKQIHESKDSEIAQLQSKILELQNLLNAEKTQSSAVIEDEVQKRRLLYLKNEEQWQSEKVDLENRVNTMTRELESLKSNTKVKDTKLQKLEASLEISQDTIDQLNSQVEDLKSNLDAKVMEVNQLHLARVEEPVERGQVSLIELDMKNSELVALNSQMKLQMENALTDQLTLKKELSNQVEIFETEILSLKQQLEEMNNTNSKLVEGNQLISISCNDIRSQLDKIKSEKELIIEECQNHMRKGEEYLEKNSILSSKLENAEMNYRESLNSLVKKHQVEVDSLTSALQDAEIANDKLVENLQDLESASKKYAFESDSLKGLLELEKSKVLSKQQECQNLQETINALQLRLGELEELHSNLELAKTTAKSTMDQLEAQSKLVITLKSQIETLHSNETSLQTLLLSETEKTANILQEFETEKAALLSQIMTRSEEVKNLNLLVNSFESKESTLNSKIMTQSEKLLELENEKRNLESNVESLSLQNGAMNEKLNTMTHSYEMKESTLQSQLKMQNENILGLESQLREMESQISHLSCQSESHADKVSNLKSLIQSLQENESSLQVTISAQNEKVFELENHVQILETEKSKLSDEIVTRSEEADEFRSHINTLEGNESTLKSQLLMESEKVSGLTHQVRDLETQIISLSLQRDSISEKFEAIKSELQCLEGEYAAVKENLSVAEVTILNLNLELKSQKERADASESLLNENLDKCKALSGDIVSRDEQLKECGETIQELNIRIDNATKELDILKSNGPYINALDLKMKLKVFYSAVMNEMSELKSIVAKYSIMKDYIANIRNGYTSDSIIVKRLRCQAQIDQDSIEFLKDELKAKTDNEAILRSGMSSLIMELDKIKNEVKEESNANWEDQRSGLLEQIQICNAKIESKERELEILAENNNLTKAESEDLKIQLETGMKRLQQEIDEKEKIRDLCTESMESNVQLQVKLEEIHNEHIPKLQSDLSNLKAENELLSHGKESLVAEVEKLRHEKQLFEKMVEMNTERTTAEHVKIQELNDEITRKDLELSNLSETLRSLKESEKALLSDFSNSEADNTLTKTKLSNALSKISNLETETSKHLVDLENMKGEIERVKSEKFDMEDKMSRLYNQLETAIDEKEVAFKTIGSKDLELKSVIEQKESIELRFVQELGNLESRLLEERQSSTVMKDTYEVKLHNLQADIASMKAEKELLHERLSQVQVMDRVETEYKENFAKMEENIKSLEFEKLELLQSESDLLEKVDNLMKHNCQLKAAIEEMEEKDDTCFNADAIRSMEEKVRTLLQKYVKGHVKGSFDEFLEQFDSLLESLAVKNEGLLMDAKAFVKEKQLLLSEITEKERQLKKYENLSELEHLIETSEMNLNKLQNDLDLLMGQYQKLQSDHAKTEKSHNQLESQLKSREKQVNQLSEENLQLLVEKEELEHQVQHQNLGKRSLPTTCDQFCQTAKSVEVDSSILEKYHNAIKINRKLQKELNDLKLLQDETCKENQEPAKKRKVVSDPEPVIKSEIRNTEIRNMENDAETDANCNQQ